MQNYKQYHEEFMQNHNGTTSWETFSVIYPAFFEVFVASTAASLALNKFKNLLGKQTTLTHFCIDFVTIIIPTIANVTILSNSFIYLTLSLIVVSAFIFFLLNTNSKTITKTEHSSSRRHFITNARSTISMISIVAILAVDFKIFPRRYAKTETFGYSLMDVGVGLFVFSNGIVAPEISRKSQTVLKSAVSSAPLWLLGCARFFLTKETDYQVHVSEYGVHWNFFITLAVTKILSSCILTFFSVNHSLLISAFVLTLHEFLLQAGLSNWVLSNSVRSSFLLANREGIVSSLGYVGLYFLSVHFGKVISKSRSGPKQDFKLGVFLLVSSFLLLSLVLVVEKYFGVSRRLANSGYCLWILFIGIFMTCLFLIGEHINNYLYNRSSESHKVFVPLIFEAVNYNGLAYFLLANILTGLINLTIQTLTYEALYSFLIMSAYMFVNCAVITVLYVKNIKLKLW